MKERSVLVVPGDYFGMDHFLRIGYGLQAPCLREALQQVDAVLEGLQPSSLRSLRR